MLFKDTTKLLEYAQLTSAVNFIGLKPTLRIVETAHILPVLGNTLYSNLNNAYALITNETSLSTADQNLLDACRAVIGPYLAYYYAPKAEVKLSDSGLQRTETANAKTAFQYQGANFREALLREGEACTEYLLQFLDDNKEAYPDWTESSAFAAYRSLFIKTGGEFNQLFPSASPYRNYWAMRAKMLQVEEQNIRTAIGSALFDHLKAVDLSPSLAFTDQEKKLMEKLKGAIANFTVAFSIPLLSVRVDANGITVMNLGPRTSRDQEAARTNAGANEFNHLIQTCNDAGAAWLKDAIKFLNDNASDFPDWSMATETTDDLCGNADLKGSFGMF